MRVSRVVQIRRTLEIIKARFTMSYQECIDTLGIGTNSITLATWGTRFDDVPEVAKARAELQRHLKYKGATTALPRETVVKIFKLRMKHTNLEVADMLKIHPGTVSRNIWSKKYASDEELALLQFELQKHIEASKSKKAIRQYDTYSKHRKVHLRYFGEPTACGAHHHTTEIIVVDDLEKVTCQNCVRRYSIYPSDISYDRQSTYK